MAEKEKIEKIAHENLVLLLEEFTKEQQVSGKMLADLLNSSEVLSEKLASLTERCVQIELLNAESIRAAIKQAVRHSLIPLQLEMAKKSSVDRKFQILLFPERDAKLFYKIVFGRWFLMLVIMFLCSCIYRFSLHQSDNNLKIEIQKIENYRLKKAWKPLYRAQNSKGKKQMDYIYNETNK